MSQHVPGPQQPPYEQPGHGYPQQPAPAYQQAAPARPLHTMKRLYVGGFFLLMIGSGCGAAMGDSQGEGTAIDGKARPAPTVTATTTVTATATVTATPSVAPADKSAAATPRKTATPAIETATLPNLVGMNHQDAQDTAQAAGFYGLREKDATGMERLLVLDRNWKVCRQEPAPGKHATDKTVTLYSVKNDESC